MSEKQIEREGVRGGSVATAKEGADDGGWVEVVRRRKVDRRGEGRMDVATNAWKVSTKDTFSFYFSDFPETHGAREMLRAFKYYGEAMEVVIPARRDRLGKRFGFVRFGNVEDPRLFAVKLDNIIFGAKKIHVNVPRFQREWSGREKQQQVREQGVATGGGNPRVIQRENEGYGRSVVAQQHKAAQFRSSMVR